MPPTETNRSTVQPLANQLPSLTPKVLKSRRRELGIAHRVLDVAVTEISLQRTGVVSPVGQCVAASMPQHVGVRLKAKLGLDPDPLHHPGKAGSGERRPTLRGEH